MSMGLVIISGATGFIGVSLTQSLIRRGYDVAVLTRNRAKAKRLFGDSVIVAEWDGKTAQGWLELASRSLAIINLAGENIGAGRWTKEKKEQLLRSRLEAGKAVVDAVIRAYPRPGTVMQASAVGYYGPRGDELLDETAPSGEGFLAELTRRWELSTQEVEDLGVRQIIIRSGLVFEKNGGILPRLIRPFRFFAGGRLGGGKQWVSWTHQKDEIRAINFLLERKDLHGVFNLTSPGPVTQKEFCRILGRVMGRPSWFPTPGFLLRLLFGQMAEETLLAGQRAIPLALLKAGFEFSYPELETALRDILG